MLGLAVKGDGHRVNLERIMVSSSGCVFNSLTPCQPQILCPNSKNLDPDIQNALAVYTIPCDVISPDESNLKPVRTTLSQDYESITRSLRTGESSE
jgi:hypothetical protein